MRTPKLKKIDLSKRCKVKGGSGSLCGHPDIRSNGSYFAIYYGQYVAGHFMKAWYGWTLDIGYMSVQLDSPGLEALWRICKK